jgi:hypothetical protein
MDKKEKEKDDQSAILSQILGEVKQLSTDMNSISRWVGDLEAARPPKKRPAESGSWADRSGSDGDPPDEPLILTDDNADLLVAAFSSSLHLTGNVGGSGTPSRLPRWR